MDLHFTRHPWPPVTLRDLPLPSALLLPGAAGLAGLAGAYIVSRHNYLLFHAAVESLRAVAAFCIFAIAWNSRSFLKFDNVWFFGTTFACTGVTVLFHMLAYRGMGVFPGGDANLPTQLWVASRWVEALALLLMVYTPPRRFPAGLTVAGVATATALLLAAVFLGAFPDCYIEGSGLTPFKKASEYATMALFAAVFVRLRWGTARLPRIQAGLLQGAVVANILGSFAFTLYVDVYGLFNFLGHGAVAVADALLLTAFIGSGIKRPQELVFWTIERDRRALAAAVERQNVELLNAAAEREQGQAELQGTREALDAIRARESAILDAVGEGILCLDRNRRVSFANQAAGLLLNAAEPLVGRPLPPVLAAALDGDAAGGPRPVDCELPLPDADGARRGVEVSARPLAPHGADALVLVIRDVTERRALEQAAARHAEAMRRALFETVGIVAGMVTARDPYTASHQRRVAHLATAIARAMELPEEEVTGIGLAASVHDIGKIAIPVELLNRPGRLRPLEYELLKTHVQAGYDILKHADLAWPIAEIIVQHHEKLDGSGYPNGLRGDRIIRGARILAVADIVEAMASHRPYRPALGIDAALAEVERCAGTTLDAEVVAACVTLFRERGYTLCDPAATPGFSTWTDAALGRGGGGR